MRWRCLLFLIYAVVDGILFGTAALRRKKTASSAEKGLTTNNPADKPARAEESSRVESESWQDLFLRVESGVAKKFATSHCPLHQHGWTSVSERL
uniref:Uncharacterized protein n=1 Tax=Hyaloperonospora arabidopsidis (strain Emoy2) TaxID=559515 RepID=M4C271_HYAAE